MPLNEDYEKEANQFAKDLLITTEYYGPFIIDWKEPIGKVV